jgi:hypothetical protein
VPPKRYVCWFLNPMNTINISPIRPINPNVKLELCEPQLNAISWPGASHCIHSSVPDPFRLRGFHRGVFHRTVNGEFARPGTWWEIAAMPIRCLSGVPKQRLRMETISTSRRRGFWPRFSDGNVNIKQVMAGQKPCFEMVVKIYVTI